MVCLYLSTHTQVHPTFVFLCWLLYQEALHAAGAVSQLLDLLTTPDDQLQTWAVAALRPLVAGNAAATTTCLENEGPFIICSLLGSTSPDMQGHALAALCTLLQTCTADDLAGLDPVQALSMVSM